MCAFGPYIALRTGSFGATTSTSPVIALKRRTPDVRSRYALKTQNSVRLIRAFHSPGIRARCAGTVTTPRGAPLPASVGAQEVSVTRRRFTTTQEIRLLPSEEGRGIFTDVCHRMLDKLSDWVNRLAAESHLRVVPQRKCTRNTVQCAVHSRQRLLRWRLALEMSVKDCA